MAIEEGQWDNLSDDDAIALLYELANNGDESTGEFARLNSMVYERFLSTYDLNATPLPKPQAGASSTMQIVSQTASETFEPRSTTGGEQPVTRTMDAAAAA